MKSILLICTAMALIGVSATSGLAAEVDGAKTLIGLRTEKGRPKPPSRSFFAFIRLLILSDRRTARWSAGRVR